MSKSFRLLKGRLLQVPPVSIVVNAYRTWEVRVKYVGSQPTDSSAQRSPACLHSPRTEPSSRKSSVNIAGSCTTWSSTTSKKASGAASARRGLTSLSDAHTSHERALSNISLTTTSAKPCGLERLCEYSSPYTANSTSDSTRPLRSHSEYGEIFPYIAAAHRLSAGKSYLGSVFVRTVLMAC